MEKRMPKKIHYAWIILIACCLMSVAGISIFGSCMGIFMTPVSESLGVAKSSFTLATATLSGLVTGFLSPLAVKLIQRKKVNLLAGGSFALMALSLVLMSRAQGLTTMALAFVLAGMGASVVFYVLTPILIGNWFKEKMAFALGIALGFSGIGGMILSPLGAACIAQFGWRRAYLFYALLVFVLGVLPALFLIKKSPKEMNLHPYGYKEEKGSADTPSVNNEELTGMTKSQALRSAKFYYVLLAAALMMILTCFTYHMPSYAPSVGLSPVFGASMISYVMLTNTLSKFVLGSACDRFGISKITCLVLTLVGAGFVLLYFAGSNPLFNSFGAVLFGFIVPTTSMFLPLIVRSVFGNRDYGEIYSYVVLVTTVASSLGVTLIEVIRSFTGGYSMPFLLAVVLVFITIGLIVLAFSGTKATENKSFASL